MAWRIIITWCRLNHPMFKADYVVNKNALKDEMDYWKAVCDDDERRGDFASLKMKATRTNLDITSRRNVHPTHSRPDTKALTKRTGL